jgi:hypothetical protein
MIKYVRRCAFLLAFLVASSLAQTPATLSPSHAAAIVRMIKAIHADEIAKAGFALALDSVKGKDPQTEALVREFSNKASSREIIERLTPLYARVFSAGDAQVVAQFYESPAGVKIIDTALKRARKEPGAILVPSSFSPGEIAALNTFAQTPAGHNFTANQELVNVEAAKMFRAWGEEFGRNKIRQAFAPLVKEADALTNGAVGDPAAPQVSAAPAPAGGSGDAFIQVASVGVEYIKRLQGVAGSYRKGVAELDPVSILKPATLVSQTAILESKQKVQRMGELLDQFLQSVDDAQKSYVTQADAIQLPEAARKSYKAGIEAGLARGYSENIRFTEIERNLIAQYGRVLDFAEARLGKISVADNKLMFSDPGDLQIYRELIAQLLSEAQQETALIKESGDRFKQSVQGLR